MSFQGIEAGKAFVEFLIKDDKLDSGLLKVADKVKKVGSIGLAASGPIVAGFAAMAAVFASTGGELDDLHRRTGLSVESLSELSYAAKVSGTDMGVVEKAAKELQKNGIDPLKFDEIADDLSQIPDHTARAQKAMEIFGARSGEELLPLLEDLPRLREEARRLGVVMSTEDSQAADRLGDAWDASKAQMAALAAQIGASIAGPLTDFLVFSQAVVAKVIDWVHQNPVLVRTLAVVATAIAGASIAALTFSAILTFISANPIISGLSAIAAGIGAVCTWFGLGSKEADKFKSSTESIGSSKVSSPAAVMKQQAAEIQSQVRGLSLSGQLRGPLTQEIVSSADSEAVNQLKSLNSVALGQLSKLGEIADLLRFRRDPVWLWGAR